MCDLATLRRLRGCSHIEGHLEIRYGALVLTSVQIWQEKYLRKQVEFKRLLKHIENKFAIDFLVTSAIVFHGYCH